MEPLERLLNLVGMLLDTDMPMTFDQIKGAMEPYSRENQASAKRMFERDKDVLREFGVPLELVDLDVWGGEQGYIIPKNLYYLPEIEFSPQELAAMMIAAQGGGSDGAVERGVQKLLYGADGGVLAGLAGGPLASGSDARSALVMATAEAVQGRRHVGFTYRTSQGSESARDVDTFAMVFRGGRWYLVGHDRERDDIRAFRLSRIKGDLTDAGQGVEPPDGFVAADHVEAGPWAAAPEEQAILWFAPDSAWIASGSLTGAQQGQPREDGWISVSVPFADQSALASLLLQFADQAVVESPASLREEMVRRLEAQVG
jgi:proteasome accessory factor B